jgi:CheY-like chemotaxis protein
MRSDSGTFDLCELITTAVRQVVPQAHSRGMEFSNDCRGAEPVLVGDRIALECALHRVLCGAVDLLKSGLLVFDAQVEPLHGGWHTVRLTAGGAGIVAGEEEVDAVLARLQMQPSDAGSDEPGSRRAVGRCPRTGADVAFASLPDQGLMWRFELELHGASALVEPPVLDARQARAWVIDADGTGPESLVKRLQRLGWATTVFASTAQAQERLRAMAPELARPALVVGFESLAVTPEGLETLVPLLPADARCVLATVPGSAILSGANRLPDIDLALLPISPGDLRRWTERLAGKADAPSGLTQPAPLLMHDRPLLLVVDDNDVNRIVAGALAESLGYETTTARDGVEAIDACCARPPDVVLMDLSMPRMDGFEATKRLRALQRSGVIPPFRIVAATADSAAQWQARCREAGTDGWLTKPLVLDAMQRELRRLDVERRTA